MNSPRPRLDRAALVRDSLVRLAAERGFGATSMADVAAAAGVAAGTIYVHYASKDELILAAYGELKAQLGEVAEKAATDVADPEATFRAVWRAIHRFLLDHPAKSRFLAQVDASPYSATAHEAATHGPGDRLLDLAERLGPLRADLPAVVLYELALGPAVRLAAGGPTLDEAALERVVTACWRAITVA